jgi:hypothetical protein
MDSRIHHFLGQRGNKLVTAAKLRISNLLQQRGVVLHPAQTLYGERNLVAVDPHEFVMAIRLLQMALLLGTDDL